MLLPDYVTLHARDSADHVWILLRFCWSLRFTVLETGAFLSNKPFLPALSLPHFKSGPHRFFEITRQISLVNIDDLFNYFVKLIHTSSKCQDLSRYDPRLSGLKSGPDPTNNEMITKTQHQLIATQFYKQLYINWWSQHKSPSSLYISRFLPKK